MRTAADGTRKNSISPIPCHCEASAHTGCGNPYPCGSGKKYKNCCGRNA
ncbi:SEC-C metal-binding domain-containing protein [Vescimonas fastidiosa]